MVRRIVLLLAACASLWAMDPERGARILREQNCLACHNVRGDGAVRAPDLAARLIDHYTPAALASLLWNHMPGMWGALSREGLGRPRPSETDAEDIFAFLYAAHFAHPPGNEARGERAFEQRGCAACHSAGPGTPVENWRGIRDPFQLVQRMWNHAAAMNDSRERRGVLFQRLSARDLADITAYASRGGGRVTSPATLPPSREGEALFKANCGSCHPGIVNLQRRMRDRTPTEVAAALWNHAGSMQTVPLAAPNDMRAITSYVWNLQFEEAGDPRRGAQVFAEKRCAGCHAQMNRGERVYTSFTMMSLWWAHGPLMQADMEKKRVRWPYLSPDDITHLVAYLNTIP
jgi:cytochrome c2